MNNAFSYIAVGIDGRKRKGTVLANSEVDAFATLRAQQLTPLELHFTAPKTQIPTKQNTKGQSSRRLKSQDIEDLLGRLAVLLRAGTDIRTALSILGDDTSTLRAMSTKILSGSTVEAAIAPVFAKSDGHLSAVIATGEVRGDLPSGLEAAAKILATRRQVQQQLFEALSYPSFVFVSAMGALSVILLVVVPAIAPLLEDSGQAMPGYFQVIVWLSEGLQVWGIYLAGFILLSAVLMLLAYRYGGLKRPVEAWLLDGPLGGIIVSIIFGAYARTLGEMLARGASLNDALRLSQKSLPFSVARERTDTIAGAVRQGRLLSEGLRLVKAFPHAIIRLCEVGEISGSMGPMLAQGGEREEALALKKIEKVSKILGPGLIVVLGALIGLIMGGVLTALTDIGSVSGG
jgi:general secretion pathway protein F